VATGADGGAGAADPDAVRDAGDGAEDELAVDDGREAGRRVR
jgi:hypothetical protein